MTMRELALDRVTIAECVATKSLATRSWVIDREADAAYLLLSKKPIMETLSFGMVNVDVEENNEAVGVELLTPTPPALKET